MHKLTPGRYAYSRPSWNGEEVTVKVLDTQPQVVRFDEYTNPVKLSDFPNDAVFRKMEETDGLTPKTL